MGGSEVGGDHPGFDGDGGLVTLQTGEVHVWVARDEEVHQGQPVDVHEGQRPRDAEEVEQKVHSGRSLGRGGCADGGDVRRGGGADVLAEDHGGGERVGEPTHRGERQGQGHGG